MTAHDDPPPPGPGPTAAEPGRTIGEEARTQAQEAKAWWDAAQRGDAAGLPPGSPPVEALAPLSTAEQDAMAAALFGDAAASPAASPPLASGPARYRRRAALAGAAMMAVAAGLVLLVLRDPPVPAYQLSMGAGDQAWRSGDPHAAEVPAYQSGSLLEIVLRPRAPIAEAPAEPEASLLDEQGGERAWPAPWERGAGGTFRSRAELGRELSLGAGLWRLRVELGPHKLEQTFRVRPAEPE